MPRPISDTQLVNDASLQGYWRLEDLNDSGPNGYTLTNNNSCAFSSGLFSNAVTTAVSGSKYLSRSYASGIANLINTGSQTIIGWFKSPGATPEGSIHRLDGGAQLIDTYVSAGTPYFRITGLTTNSSVASTVSVVADKWYFMAGVYDSANSKLKIWINNILTEVTASGTANMSGTPSWNIGSAAGGSNIFSGQIDDVAVFNRALSDAEIRSYLNGDSATEISSMSLGSDPNLQGYWKMEANGNDSSGNGYTLTGTNRGYVFGRFGNGGDFEASSSDYITNTSAASCLVSGSQTWSCWVKPETTGSGGVFRIFGRMLASSPFNGVAILRAPSPDYIGFQCYGLTTNTVVYSNVEMDVGNWMHLAGVYDSANSKLKIFVNGVKTEVTASGTILTGGSEALSIGRSGAYVGDYFDGMVDDAAMFDRALSDDEILAIYQGSLTPTTNYLKEYRRTRFPGSVTGI